MPEGTTPEVFNKEIAELEAKLAAKKQEMLRSGIESPEKTVFKEVVREHSTPGEQPRVTIPVSKPQTTTQTTRQVTPQEEQQINLLIAHAFTKGLAAAISEAKKTGDPFFIDLLHDRLADEYYQKLVTARKVNPS
jgi:hypothetical protein